MEIRIDETLKKLIPPLSPEEYFTLEKSILSEGCREPLIVWNGIIVDGHNRYNICSQHSIDYKLFEKSFDSLDDAKVWMIDNQKGRRNLTDGWKYELAQVKKAILAEKGKENIKTPTGGRAGLTLSKTDKVVNTQKEIADDLGWSTGKTAQADYVWNHGDEEIKDKVKSGDFSINKAYETLKKPHVSNNSGENEWYTPKNIIESARQAMGSIDFDPASCELANETVKASQFCTKEDSGLEKNWSGNVWLNPPYAQPLIMQFCEKVVEQKCNYNQAIILVNNATETAWFRKLISVADAVCFTSGRVKFIDKNGNPTGAPLQGQAIIYIGENLRDFKEAFKETGWIAIIEE